MKKPAPWGEEGSVRGPLAWSHDELAAAMHGMELPEPTAEAEAEAQWEAELFAAIESGAIGRGKPGRKQLRPRYLAIAQKQLEEANGNFAQAREAFIKQETKSQSIERKTPENRWAEAMKTLFPTR